MASIISLITANIMVTASIGALILVLIILAIVSKSRTAKIVEQVPVAPVTTTPKQAEPTEPVAQPVIPPVVEAVATPVVPEPVKVEAVVAEPVVPVVAPVAEAVVPSWRPTEAELTPLVEEKPAEAVVATPAITEDPLVTLMQEEPAKTEALPIVADTISPQAVATEVIDELPVVEKEATPKVPMA